MIWLLLFTILVRASENVARTNWLTTTKTCKSTSSPKSVMVIKQWHLSPATNTALNPSQKLPQSENQVAIYTQLDQWVHEKKVDVILAEGCEGPINAQFPLEFNGWTYNSLKKVSNSPDYAQIATHVPLKLEAKYGPMVETVCGDDADLVKAGSLHLSNIRGLTGFYARIKDSKVRSKDLDSYIEGDVQALKIPATKDKKIVLGQLKANIEKEISAFAESLGKRNRKMVETIDKTPGKTFAVVIGGLHGDDLAHQLEKKGFNCSLFEPKGYSPKAESLISDLKKSIH